MIIYKNRCTYDELLSKLEEFEPNSKFSEDMGWDGLPIHSKIYYKLYNIIKNYNYINDLPYIREILSQIMNGLIKNPRHEYIYKFYNSRLCILECRLQHESGGQYHHDYFCMRDLPKLGCIYANIENLMYMKNGSPDFKAESIFGNEWEIKIIAGNKIIFTHSQLEKFNRNVNLLIYRRTEPNAYVHRINHVGAVFHNHIKFGDIYDALLDKKSYFPHKFGNRLLDNIPIIYQIDVEDSLESAKSIIECRYRQESSRFMV